jgi:hypothetical protein
VIFTRNINRQFESSACFDSGREAVSEQSSEQGFADATRKQIRLGVPGDGFREEPERAAAARFVAEHRHYPLRRLCHFQVHGDEMMKRRRACAV